MRVFSRLLECHLIDILLYLQASYCNVSKDYRRSDTDLCLLSNYEENMKLYWHVLRWVCCWQCFAVSCHILSHPKSLKYINNEYSQLILIINKLIWVSAFTLSRTKRYIGISHSSKVMSMWEYFQRVIWLRHIYTDNLYVWHGRIQNSHTQTHTHAHTRTHTTPHPIHARVCTAQRDPGYEAISLFILWRSRMVRGKLLSDRDIFTLWQYGSHTD